MRIAGLCLLLATPAHGQPSDTREGAMVLDEPRWASETMLIVSAHALRGVA